MADLWTQYQAALSSWTDGDFNSFKAMLESPDSITTDELATVADKLGLKNSFLRAATNLATDPTVLIAFLMSRKFPTAQFLKGTIPHRFVGANNEFSGVSLFTRPVEGFFRGTPISGLVALKQIREQEVLKVGERIFDVIGSRANWKNEMPLVAMIMEGQTPAGASQELYGVASKIRQGMEDLYNNFLSKVQQVDGGFSTEGAITMAQASPFPPGKAPKHLRNYLPHIPLKGETSTYEVSPEAALKQLASGKTAQLFEATQVNPNQIWSQGADGSLVSDWGKYQEFMNRVGAKVFNPRLFRRQRHNILLNSQQGSELFITDLNIILQKYIHSVARSYANNAPLTLKERMMARVKVETADGRVETITPSESPILPQIINYGLQASARGNRLQVVDEVIPGTNRVVSRVDRKNIQAPSLRALQNLVRSVQGLKGEDKIIMGNLMDSVRFRIQNDVTLKDSTKLKFSRALEALDTVDDQKSLSSRMATFFYGTTLGANFSSAFKNMLQPFLTTAPSIGIGATLQGYSALRKGLPKYFSNVRKFQAQLSQEPGFQGGKRAVEKFLLSMDRAFEETFPELAAQGIKADPRLFEQEVSAALEGMSRITGAADKMETLTRTLLIPFTNTERANQIITFYGARNALRKQASLGALDIPTGIDGAKLGPRDLEDFFNFQAGQVVRATQFFPGPGSRTVFQSMLPAPLRMFSSFPIRLLNFHSEATVRGAMLDSQLRGAGAMTRLFGGRNYGTLLRVYTHGRIMEEGLREGLGVDVSDALGITGPFNFDPAEGKLGIFPVPPVASVVTGLVKATSTRDIRHLQPLELPMVGKVPIPKTLFPGGVAASRMGRAVNQWRPDLGGFVDENERLQYEANTTDFILSAMGIPLDKERRMREQLDILGANRRRIRDLKRAYTVAAVNTNFDEQSKIQEKYSQEFPDMAAIAPLTVTPKDIFRYQQTQRLTSVQRLLRNMPEAQGRFTELTFQQLDPDLLGDFPTFE